MNNKSGIVYLKEFSDSIEKPFDIRKPDLNDDDLLSVMPQQTSIRGLDLQRQWYLYENIRQHCHSNLAADITCPKPTLPKPHGQASNMVASGATRKRPRKCGKGGNTGHNKKPSDLWHYFAQNNVVGAHRLNCYLNPHRYFQYFL